MYISTKVDCFILNKDSNSLPIFVIKKDNFKMWLSQQDIFLQNFTKQFDDTKNIIIVPDDKGNLQKVICIVSDDMFSMANIVDTLMPANYHIEYSDIDDLSLYYLGFALGSYKFDKYKSQPQQARIKLYLPQQYKHILVTVEANYLVRDMINTPAEDMGPDDIANVVKKLSDEFCADFEAITGKELAKQGYMGIYTVGKGSNREPKLVRLNWGDKNNPLISIVGKGVAFDTGGLDLKSSSAMQLMHKDMGGSANAIGLAYMIMKHNLPVRLNLVIPTVENAISGESYRPSDIIKMKNGTTVQVTNTDAEGRLILAEPLYEEAQKKPDYLIDFATLTGSARVAVGTEIAAFFCNNDDVANQIYKYAQISQDKVWRLPLADCYRKSLETDFADISHCDLSSYAGAVKAALFLEYFVGIKDAPKWIHFDIMAWNIVSTPGKPKGGEMMGVRAIFEMLKDTFLF
ncbi:MAG: leucyl aminopeptidase family protein [Francisella sp.]